MRLAFASLINRFTAVYQVQTIFAADADDSSWSEGRLTRQTVQSYAPQAALYRGTPQTTCNPQDTLPCIESKPWVEPQKSLTTSTLHLFVQTLTLAYLRVLYLRTPDHLLALCSVQWDGKMSMHGDLWFVAVATYLIHVPVQYQF